MGHVNDSARAYVALLSHKDAHGVYTVSGENGVTGKEFAEIIAAKLQCKAESVKLKQAKNCLDPSLVG